MSVAIGHPPFAGYCILPGRFISFTTKNAVVRDLHDNTIKFFGVKIPFVSGIPVQKCLFAKKTIRWLLKNGYCPAFEGKDVTFKKPPAQDSADNNPELNKLLDACDEVITALRMEPVVDVFKNLKLDEQSFATGDYEEEPDSSGATIEQFKANLEEGAFELAFSCIEAVYAQMPHSNSVKRLYADFLKFCKHPRACMLYLELSNGKNRECLEKALECDPANNQVYEQLLQGSANRERMVYYYLYGYLQLREVDPDRAEELYKQALLLAPDEPLIYLARMQGTKERQELYQHLLKIFESRADENAARYYRNKIPDAARLHAMTRVVSRTIVPEKPAPPLNAKIGYVYRYIDYPEAEDDTFPAAFSLVTKESKRNELEQIDAYIKSGQMTLAEDAIRNAQHKWGNKASIYKRRCIIHQKQGSHNGLLQALKELQVIYAQNPNKAAKAKLIEALVDDFKNKIHAAISLYQAGKQGNAVKMLLDIARDEYKQGNKQNIAHCISKIVVIDPACKAFSVSEKRIIALLCQYVGIAIPDAIPLVEVQKVQREVEGCPRLMGAFAFRLDHPTFVACYGDTKSLYLFTPISARLGNVEYPVRPVYPDAMPFYDKLSLSRAICWLLENGYIPVLQEGQVTFVPLTEKMQLQQLAQSCQGAFTETTAFLLEECRKHIGLMQKALAFEYAKKAYDYEATLKNPSTVVAEFYADFLYAMQMPDDAKRVYVAIGNVQKACISDAAGIEPKALSLTTCLWGMLQYQKQDPQRARMFYELAQERNPLLARLAELSMCKGCKQKATLYNVLESENKEYYAQKAKYCDAGTDITCTSLQSFLSVIDFLIENEEYEQAFVIIKKAVTYLRAHSSAGWVRYVKGYDQTYARFEGETPEFLEREVVVYKMLGEKERLVDALYHLRELYFELQNPAMMLFISRIGYYLFREVRFSGVYASDLFLRGGSKEESVQLYLEVAVIYAKKGDIHEVQRALLAIRKIDPEDRILQGDDAFIRILLEAVADNSNF